LGYDALRKKQYNKAAAFFKMNTEDYPSSSNVFDSYGDSFAARKDTANAIMNYEKALANRMNAVTLHKMNVLKKKPPYQLSIDELKKYTGVYILENYNLPVVLELQNGKLLAKVSGDSDSELLPVAKDLFTVKNKQGYSISFSFQNNKPAYFISVQPNGTFRGNYKQD
jgi:hypothetical protein